MSIANLEHTNRLAGEKSPYLLQHSHNPVDWFPWGEAAFAKAKAEDKPIFLSIGYATCHWCHVMERESFENAAVAEFLNERFISIKVDREERPDVDRVYMTAVQAIAGQGGWPLTAFLSPDLKPFYGGTYYPPENRHNLPGFLTLLRQIDKLWRERRADLTRSAAEWYKHLTQAIKARAHTEAALGPTLLHEAAARFTEEFDELNGGFGGAPKFPRPAVPLFLLRYGAQFSDEEAVDRVVLTCDRMASGGIHDQIGGGFARYSVDAEWLVPHFEKMLYDNAQLAQLYLEAYQATGQPRHAEVVRDILAYVRRDLTHPEGGFYSAEDADSEGKEGKFYCWTREELAGLLTPEELRAAERHLGVTATGNFVDHSDPHPLPHQNVLSLRLPPKDAAERQRLDAVKAKLFAARQNRARPLLDDKVLASWNGLMLGAFARAHAVLGEAEFAQVAGRNLAFLREKLWDPESQRLSHRWREGERDAVRLLDDSAFVLLGALDLYEATLNPEPLAFAIQVADAMLEEFYDPEQGGFWQSGPRTDHLVFRMKEDYDGAEPAGNSAAVLGLLRLRAITGRAAYQPAVGQTLRWLAPKLATSPQAVPFGLVALQFSLEPPVRIVLAGIGEGSALAPWLRAAHKAYVPRKVILSPAGAVDPFTQTLAATQPTAYLCRGATCDLPIYSPAQLEEKLAGLA
jgi:uncharacterized protein